MINVTVFKKAMKQQAKLGPIWWQVDSAGRSLIGGSHMMVALESHELDGKLISALSDVGLIKHNMAVQYADLKVEVPAPDIAGIVKQLDTVHGLVRAVDTKLEFDGKRVLHVPGERWTIVDRNYFETFPASTEWGAPKGRNGALIIPGKAIVMPVGIPWDHEVFTYLKYPKGDM